MEAKKLKPHLDKLLKQARWSFDLEDCDNILRIDSLTNLSEEVINLLKEKGFDCVELTD